MGGLFGGTETKSTIPGWVKKPALQNLQNAQAVAGMGYTPYYGPDVAAFSPMQNAAFDGTNQAAAAFGMPTSQGNGMPAPQTFAGGVQGYASAPMYQQAIDTLKANNPEKYAALMGVLNQFSQQGQPAAQPAPVAEPAGPGWLNQLNMSFADRIRTSEGSDAGVNYPTGGSGGMGAMGSLLSYAPGGVTTRNPSSLLNRTAAALTSRPQSAPTAANRPMARR